MIEWFISVRQMDLKSISGTYVALMLQCREKCQWLSVVECLDWCVLSCSVTLPMELPANEPNTNSQTATRLLQSTKCISIQDVCPLGLLFLPDLHRMFSDISRQIIVIAEEIIWMWLVSTTGRSSHCIYYHCSCGSK